MEIKQYHLDCHKLNDEKNVHKYLKDVFGFPEYYGENLDALYDCLSEIAYLNIILDKYDDISNEGQKILDIIFRVVIENGGEIVKSNN